MLLTGVVLALQVAVGLDTPTVAEARSAQRAFELMRRMHLPRTARDGYQPCDIRVGRFCYWYAPGEPDPPPESGLVSGGRQELLHLLQLASAAHPADGWLPGQRVRYHMEANQPDRALAALSRCGAETWWCSSLAGMVLHEAGRDREADSAFTISLSAMDSAHLCDWLDLSPLTGDELPCSARRGAAETLWLLGQPLWSAPGRDFRSEILARRTMAVILAESANVRGMRWGSDNAELLLRYGWARWYSRLRDAATTVYSDDHVRGHDREPSFAVLPEARIFSDSLPRIAPESWDFDNPLARARYAPLLVSALLPAASQLARFPRGDSMLVAAAVSTTDAGLAADSTSRWLLGFDGSRLHHPTEDATPLLLTMPNTGWIAGIEVVGARSGRAARTRVTVEPLSCGAGVCLSDLLIYAGDTAAATIAQALPLAIADGRVSVSRGLGVLWEIHGMAAGSRARVTLAVSPPRPGLARRLAIRLGLARDRTAARMQWDTVVRTTPQTEVIVLSLPDGARGSHTVSLVVEFARGSVSAARDVELVP